MFAFGARVFNMRFVKGQNYCGYFSLSCIGEGNGNPLQCSCLENPRDGGAWWAAVYGVAQSWTRLKQLSSSSSGLCMILGRKSNLLFSILYLFFLYEGLSFLSFSISFKWKEFLFLLWSPTAFMEKLSFPRFENATSTIRLHLCGLQSVSGVLALCLAL